MKYFYALLCILGTIAPYGAFLPWLSEHGLDITLLLNTAAGSSVSLFAWLDVIISAVVLGVFIGAEGLRLRMTYLWFPILATVVVGVSLGLPLFLLLRELHLSKYSDSAYD